MEASPDRLTGTARRRVPGSVPLQITTGMPAEVAISAHSTLLDIPPEPMCEPDIPIS